MTNLMTLEEAKRLDAFYTNDCTALHCIQSLASIVDISSFKHIIEPSAGGGAFIRALNNVGIDANRIEAFDINPTSDGITAQDWLDERFQNTLKHDISSIPDSNVLIVGNPPFGKRASLAKAFIRAAIELNASVIALILPNTFNKFLSQKVFPSDYRLISNERLDDDSFIICGAPYHVPASFQVWINNASICAGIDMRAVKALQSTAYSFLSRGSSDADFAVNGNSGKVHAIDDIVNSKAEHYIKVNDGYDASIVRSVFESASYPHESSVNGGNYWISQNELNSAFNNCIEDNGITDFDMKLHH